MEKKFNLLFLFSFTLILGCVWFTFYSFSVRYPYYLIWDMDLITIQDLILIQSGYFPDHIAHPGFGMYLILFFTHKLAFLINYVSLLDLSTLASSLNPIMGLAELTFFVRLHSPLILVGIIFLLWLSIQMLFRPSQLISVCVLLLLSTQSSFYYHAAFIRSEIYALFFWSLSILFLSVYLSRESRVPSKWWIFLAGVMLSLCHITKTQAITYIVMMPILFIFLLVYKNKIKFVSLSPAIPPWAIRLNGIVVIIFLWLCWNAPVPEGAFTNARRYIPNPDAFMLIGSLLLTVIIPQNAKNPHLSLIPKLLTPLMSGYLCAFTLHLVMFPNINQSIHYLFLDGKMALFRSGYYMTAAEFFINSYKIFIQEFIRNPFYYVANLVFIIELARISTKKERLILFTLVAMTYLIVTMGTRPSLRDWIFRQLVVFYTTILFFIIWAQKSNRGKNVIKRYIYAGMGTLLIFFNVRDCLAMPKRVEAGIYSYGWDEPIFFKSVYNGNQILYENTLTKSYEFQSPNERRGVALENAHRFREVRIDVSTVFPNQVITHRNIGIVSEGFPLWSDNFQYKIDGFSESLRNGILVDNHAIVPKNLKIDLGNDSGNNIKKFKSNSQKLLVTVMPRTDLEVFLFTENEKDFPLISGSKIPGSLIINITGPDGPAIFNATLLKDYSVFNIDDINGRFFFVILKKSI